jgi:hypothetical protein
VLAQDDTFSPQDYDEALTRGHSLAREQGIDAVLTDLDLDALVAPTGSPAWPTDLINGDHFTGASSGPCAVAGYPIINVPMGNAFGLPVGISFMGTAYSEPKLIGLASGFEHVMGARIVPQYRRSVHQGLVGRGSARPFPHGTGSPPRGPARSKGLTATPAARPLTLRHRWAADPRAIPARVRFRPGLGRCRGGHRLHFTRCFSNPSSSPTFSSARATSTPRRPSRSRRKPASCPSTCARHGPTNSAPWPTRSSRASSSPI